MITDVQAAELVLKLIARSDFKGPELPALVALDQWARTTINSQHKDVDDGEE